MSNLPKNPKAYIYPGEPPEEKTGRSVSAKEIKKGEELIEENKRIINDYCKKNALNYQIS